MKIWRKIIQLIIFKFRFIIYLFYLHHSYDWWLHLRKYSHQPLGICLPCQWILDDFHFGFPICMTLADISPTIVDLIKKWRKILWVSIKSNSKEFLTFYHFKIVSKIDWALLAEKDCILLVLLVEKKNCTKNVKFKRSYPKSTLSKLFLDFCHPADFQYFTLHVHTKKVSFCKIFEKTK